MLGNIGYPEMLVLLALVLLIFGPKNLPKLANSMGRAITDFKKGLSGMDRELREEVERDDEKQAAEKLAAKSDSAQSTEPKA